LKVIIKLVTYLSVQTKGLEDGYDDKYPHFWKRSFDTTE